MNQTLHGRYHVIDTEPTNRSISSFYSETDIANCYITRALPNAVATTAKEMMTVFLDSDLAAIFKAAEAEKIRRVTVRLTV